MNDIIAHKELFEIINSYPNYTLINNVIEVDKDALKLKKIEELGLKTEKLYDKDRILLENNIRIYNSKDSFLANNRIVENDNILVIDNDSALSYIDNKNYLNFVINDDLYLFSNSLSYLEFLKELKKLESEIDGTFHFIDSFNSDSRKITFVSLAEKSRVVINYESKIPNFNENINYALGFNNFLNCFGSENKNLAKFLKNAITNTVINFDSKNRMQFFFENLDSIIHKAKLNFEVYLNELSIDKVKKDYDEVKTKYFSSLSEMLSKITTGILALPIAVATLLFAIEKLKDFDYYLYMLIVIIIVSSIFITSLLGIYYKDLSFTKKLLEKDYKILIENNFFTKYEDEKEIFDEIKIRISDRVKFLHLIVESYFWVMNLSNLAIIGLMLYYLGLREVQIIIPLMLVLLVIGIFKDKIIQK